MIEALNRQEHEKHPDQKLLWRCPGCPRVLAKGEDHAPNLCQRIEDCLEVNGIDSVDGKCPQKGTCNHHSDCRGDSPQYCMSCDKCRSAAQARDGRKNCPGKARQGLADGANCPASNGEAGFCVRLWDAAKNINYCDKHQDFAGEGCPDVPNDKHLKSSTGPEDSTTAAHPDCVDVSGTYSSSVGHRIAHLSKTGCEVRGTLDEAPPETGSIAGNVISMFGRTGVITNDVIEWKDGAVWTRMSISSAPMDDSSKKIKHKKDAGEDALARERRILSGMPLTDR